MEQEKCRQILQVNKMILTFDSRFKLLLSWIFYASVYVWLLFCASLLSYILYHHVFFFLLAMAEVYLKEGDNEYSKGETNNAVHFYSEGLQVNCKDVKLNAILYSNRAAAQLLLGKN